MEGFEQVVPSRPCARTADESIAAFAAEYFSQQPSVPESAKKRNAVNAGIMVRVNTKHASLRVGFSKGVESQGRRTKYGML
mmetsp:Transcript_27548/g.55128  ORF Transcript_27548/g.55128 Transcript_27548/m.55128 type:complete len:81 (-) Transcript_27548:24-266(-)